MSRRTPAVAVLLAVLVGCCASAALGFGEQCVAQLDAGKYSISAVATNEISTEIESTEVARSEGSSELCSWSVCPDGSSCVWALFEGADASGTLVLLRDDGSVELEAAVKGLALDLAKLALSKDQQSGAQTFHGLSLSADKTSLLVAERNSLLQDWKAESAPAETSPARLAIFDVKHDDASPASLQHVKTVVHHLTGSDSDHQSSQMKTDTTTAAAVWLGDDLVIVESSVTQFKRVLALFTGGPQTVSRSAFRMYRIDPSSMAEATDVSACESIDSGCTYNALEKEPLLTTQDSLWSPAQPIEQELMAFGRRVLAGEGAINVLSAHGSDYGPSAGGVRQEGKAFGARIQDIGSQVLSYNPLVPLWAGRGSFAVIVLGTWSAYFFAYPLAFGKKEDPNASWWQRNNNLVFTFAHLRNFLVSGVIYGYPALEVVMRAQGVYGEGCTPGDNQCPTQIQGFAIVSLAGFLLNIAGRPLWGYGLDIIGPRATSTAGMSVCNLGIVFMIFAGAARPWCYVIGWGLLGFGGASIHLANFHIQNLYPKNKKPVSASFTITFSASAIMFTFWAIAYDLGLPWATVMVIYLGMSGGVTLISWFVQPAENIGRDGHTATERKALGVPAGAPVVTPAATPASSAKDLPSLSEKEMKGGAASPKAVKSALNKDIEAVKAAAPPMSKTGSSSSLQSEDGDWNVMTKEALSSFEYWSETLWFCFGVLEYQWYIGTIAAQFLLFPIEATATADEIAGIQFAYVSDAAWFNALSGLAWPISAWLLAAFDGLNPSIYVQLFATIIYTFTLSIPKFWIQPVTFIFQGISRFILFSAHHSYLSTEFPMKIFGVLNAATYTTSSVFTFMVFPLQLLAIYVLDGYTLINSFFIVANIAIILVMGFASIVRFFIPKESGKDVTA